MCHESRHDIIIMPQKFQDCGYMYSSNQTFVPFFANLITMSGKWSAKQDLKSIKMKQSRYYFNYNVYLHTNYIPGSTCKMPSTTEGAILTAFK